MEARLIIFQVILNFYFLFSDVFRKSCFIFVVERLVMIKYIYIYIYSNLILIFMPFTNQHY